MVLIRIVYWDDTVPEAKSMDIDHLDWNAQVPDTILKVFIERETNPSVWVEISGRNAYVIKEISGVVYRASVHNTNLNGLDGSKLIRKLETMIDPKPATKFGIEITDEQWAVVTSTNWV